MGLVEGVASRAAAFTARTSIIDAGADLVVTVEAPEASEHVDAVVRSGVLEVVDAGEIRAAVALPCAVEPGPAAFLRDGDLLTVTLRKLH